MMRTGAKFSRCRKYRYVLWRIWDESKPMCAFIGLNPSTADEVKNDPTVTRCINYAKAWDCGGLYMLNIFAYRATDPKVMKAQNDPIGPENNKHLDLYTGMSEIRIAAWGTHGSYLNRGRDVAALLANLKCLGITQSGHPKHPLYLRSDTKPIRLGGIGITSAL